MQYNEIVNNTFPLFIRDTGTTKYRYYGTYKEPCASNAIRSDEMSQVSHHVEKYWASELGILR